MRHLYSYKFRLSPTPEQEVLLAKHFGCCRWVYNYFLGKRIEEYKINKKTLKRSENEKELPLLKKDKIWLKEVGSQSLQYNVECLQNAYNNFFRKVKQKVKGKKGFPRFKKKHGKQSFRIKQNILLVDDRLVCPKFLEGIPVIQHREVEGEIQFATISRNKAGQYHVSITVEREIQSLPETAEVIAYDLNVHGMVDSNGNVEVNPRPSKQYAKRLKLLHQRVSRAEKGKNGRKKACIKLAKLYLKVHNKREDHLHKLSRRIVDENQVICIEDLAVSDMLANTKPDERDEPRWKEKRRHKDIQDCGFYSLVQKLMYKAVWYGRTVVKVSRWFPSSQLCNHCGWRYEDLPKDCKEWCCWNCWENNQRDHNSAKNVLGEGLKILTSGTEGIAVCLGVRPAQSGLLIGTEAPPSLAAG
jgi:putative transposase